ncbi:MAG: hypothetical protein M3Q93_04700, partial [Gemmatimonadota bacterium]|nr:hypothetical protein [Gemmatimonadota bacterium]
MSALASDKGASVRLLVSVRSPAEIPPALEGGAEIIDAKDPSRG